MIKESIATLFFQFIGEDFDFDSDEVKKLLTKRGDEHKLNTFSCKKYILRKLIREFIKKVLIN